MQELQRIERESWRRYLFYVDLGMCMVLIISLVLMGRHAFAGGYEYALGQFHLSTAALWNVVADTVFAVLSLSWLLYRLFYNQYLVLTRRL